MIGSLVPNIGNVLLNDVVGVAVHEEPVAIQRRILASFDRVPALENLGVGTVHGLASGAYLVDDQWLRRQVVVVVVIKVPFEVGRCLRPNGTQGLDELGRAAVSFLVLQKSVTQRFRKHSRPTRTR